MIERNRFKTTAVLLLICGPMLMIVGRAGAARETPSGVPRPNHPILVYESSRPALRVSITRLGDRIIRASVGAPGLCSNGEKTGVGFALTGGTGYVIHPDGTFYNKGGDRKYFRGRFAGDKVSGAFRTYERRNIGGERIEPYCGNIEPRGRNQRFVARLIEVDGKRVRSR